MLFGAHESVAGGLAKAFGRATGDHCRALQIFTKNSNSWREPALSDKDIDGFRRAHAEAGAPPVLAHTSYLINLASLKDETLTRSKGALVAELDRSTSLGIAFCVLHPGAHLGAGDDTGLAQIVASLDEVHARTPGATALTLLENTAGQGTCVGHRFEHLAELLSRVKQPERMGVCLDTQHAFAAGYDATTPEGYGRVFEEFDRVVGLKWLRAFHLNDSKKP
ncbi:MAG: deoxyribonuclease IV, partial [Myxococcales bacterium]